MKKNVILLATMSLVPITQQAVSATHEISGGYTYSKIENTTTINSFKSEEDFKSDNYLATYSFYSTNLKDNLYPELAILNTHPSFLRFGFSSAKNEIENNPSLESEDYLAEGRYSFDNGIGLGCGINYSNMDYSSANPNFDADSYNIFLSIDYSKSDQSNISLALSKTSSDAENNVFDSDGYAIDGALEVVFQNLYVVKPTAGYAEQNYDGQNITDYKTYLLGGEVGFLFSENLSVFIGGDFNATRYDDNSDSDIYKIFIQPKYWFNKNMNLNLKLDYQDGKADFGQNTQFAVEGYSGNAYFSYRF